VAWLRRLARAGLWFRGIYDAWQLPTAELLDALSSCFAPGSTLVYSPECGSDRVRTAVRPGAFSSAELLGSLAEAERRGLATHLFFSAGLPGETEADVDQTARLIERVRSRTRAAISVTPMFIDPASPVWSEPGRYGVRLVRRSLADFHDEVGLPGGPGYETERFDEAGILAAVDRLLRLARG
jgi:radical SAM superfamily enzyme YgiQ (UPF0313 family)